MLGITVLMIKDYFVAYRQEEERNMVNIVCKFFFL